MTVESRMKCNSVKVVAAMGNLDGRLGQQERLAFIMCIGLVVRCATSAVI